MFRRLYWVAEQVDSSGRSIVTGVYTSIQDLVGKGLHWCEGSPSSSKFRLTLVKPDSFNCPLARFDNTDFSSLEDKLQPFVDTNEYSMDEVKMLRESIDHFLAGAAAA